MPLFGQSVLSTAYFPPADYFFALQHSGKVLLECSEYYEKQSYRNRCTIFSTGGVEALTIPVVHTGNRMPVKDVRIDYDYPWVMRHKRALEAAYNSSAFFEYYRDELFSILDSRGNFLLDLNMRLLEKLLEMLGMHPVIEFTQEYRVCYDEGTSDFRKRIHPKYKGQSLMEEYGRQRPWFQVFEVKPGLVLPEKTIPGIVPGTEFIPNLSVLDLLFAEGPDALSFL